MKRTLAVTILGTALALGIFADLAVRDVPPGLSLFLWICGVVLGLAILRQRSRMEVVREWKWMAGSTVVLGVTFLWRDADGLRALAVLAMGVAFILTTLRGARPALAECGLLEYAHAAFMNAVHATVGFPLLLLSDLRPEAASAAGAPRRRTAEVARGLAISLPVVFVIGSLFVGADAVFQKIVNSVFNIDLSELFAHLFFAGFVTWVITGYFRGAFIAQPVAFPYTRNKPISLGITEVSIVLGSSILLFALFLAVQFRYLFGGADLVQVTPSLTYAEYARRGFFELTTVVALVLPMLLGLDWLLRKETPAQVNLFRILAAVQVLLLFAVIASALQRMLLYLQEYGLTEMRVYTTAFMSWMALLLLWYVLTVLTGHRSRFALAAVGTAFMVILVLVVMNPEDLIARTNIARASEGKRMDVRYLSVLGNDAVPALVEGFTALDEKSKATLAGNLLKRKERLAGEDWRSWSWSSYVALRTLAGYEGELRKAVSRSQ